MVKKGLFCIKIGPGKIYPANGPQPTKPKNSIGLEGYLSLVSHSWRKGRGSTEKRLKNG